VSDALTTDLAGAFADGLDCFRGDIPSDRSTRFRGESGSMTGSASVPADLDLLRRVAQRDEAALGILYDRFGGIVYALAHRIVGQQVDAEEVAMETFSQVWRDAGKFDASRGTVAAWLCIIARSRALDLVRSHSRRQRLTDSVAREPVDEAVGAPDVLHDERRQAVGAALAELPEAQREAIELAYYQGLSQSEIAERLQQPLGTIKTRMRTGMLRLREMLRGYYFEGAS
jgi:RNA polymerase sigma-70 factor, ECF subfamily